MQTYGLRFTWSRVAPNVVEHLAAPATDDDPFQMPVCGRSLSIRTQTLGSRNDSYPMCRRCSGVLFRIGLVADRFIREFPDAEATVANVADMYANGRTHVDDVRPVKPELYPLVCQVVEAKRAAA